MLMFLGLVLFIVVYVLVVIATMAFSAFACYVGFRIAIVGAGVYGVAIGLAFVVTAVMLIAYVFKFIFMKWTPDQSNTIEITEDDQPDLIAFIHRVADEAGAPGPRRILLGPEVNAGVFYTSSFWGMFFPVRKSLRIGLGLVNSLNMGEFKAIIAHEFGHFSQRSMKLGSYSYTVSRILHNLLFDNAAYARALSGLASMWWWLKLSAHITAAVIGRIQWVLSRTYSITGKADKALSREMEFHADTVAASVAGSNQLISSLYRLEVGNFCLAWISDFYAKQSEGNARPDNVFPQHRELLLRYASKYGLPQDGGLPQVDASSPGPGVRSRVVIIDPWATHPTHHNRELRLKELGLSAEPSVESPWALFRNPESLQEQMTEMLFPQRADAKSQTVLGLEGFRDSLDGMRRDLNLPDVFRGYFEYHHLDPPDPDTLAAEPTEACPESLDVILTEEACGLDKNIPMHQADIFLLTGISQKHFDAKEFDFDGTKYRAEEAAEISHRLEGTLKDLDARMTATDRRLTHFFLQEATARGKRSEFLVLERVYFTSYKRYQEMAHLSQSAAAEAHAVLNPSPGPVKGWADSLLTLVLSEAALRSAIKPILLENLGRSMPEKMRATLAGYENGIGVYVEAIPSDPAKEEYVCPQCGIDVTMETSECPKCKEKLDWSAEKEKKEYSFRCSICGHPINTISPLCSGCDRSRADIEKLNEASRLIAHAARLSMDVTMKQLLDFEATLLVPETRARKSHESAGHAKADGGR